MTMDNELLEILKLTLCYLKRSVDNNRDPETAIKWARLVKVLRDMMKEEKTHVGIN